jgi:N-acetyl-gamma-glutamyl-phosphate reductase
MKIAVVGASGYVGAEVVRWLTAHDVEIAPLSTTRVGMKLSDVVPGLLGIADQVIGPFSDAQHADVVVLATPHGAAADLVQHLKSVPLIVDCSADHRHAEGWVYGMAEWNAEALADASRIAVPGCFATAIALALAPLAAAGLLTDAVQISAATGSTGSGASAKVATHHPARFANFKAYKVLNHQHVPEVVSFLKGLGSCESLYFVPHSLPIDRGIFATCFATVDRDVCVETLFADAYARQPHIRLRDGTPELRWVRGTSFCDLAVHRDGDQVVVLSAIDNLGKGAAGQAVQCLQLALDLPTLTRIAPCTP